MLLIILKNFLLLWELLTECGASNTEFLRGRSITGGFGSCGLNGGQGGIRTLDELAPMPLFESGAFNLSATCP